MHDGALRRPHINVTVAGHGMPATIDQGLIGHLVQRDFQGGTVGLRGGSVIFVIGGSVGKVRGGRLLGRVGGVVGGVRVGWGRFVWECCW